MDLVALFLVAVLLVGVYLAWPASSAEDESCCADEDALTSFDLSKTNLQLGKVYPLEPTVLGDRF